MTDVVTMITERLQLMGDNNYLETNKRFHKPGTQPLAFGVKMNKVNELAKEIYKSIKGISKNELLEICDELFSSQYFESKIIACRLSEKYVKKFAGDDFAIFQKWVDQNVVSWADCDTLCCTTIGDFIIHNQDYVQNVMNWANSDHLWSKRASAVALINGAKKGIFLQESFYVTSSLMNDSRDLVQKGYGWLLKEQTKYHLESVFDFLRNNKHKIPRTAFRYAIEKMPIDKKTEAMSWH